MVLRGSENPREMRRNREELRLGRGNQVLGEEAGPHFPAAVFFFAGIFFGAVPGRGLAVTR